jgi:hypothetical protein
MNPQSEIYNPKSPVMSNFSEDCDSSKKVIIV